MKYNSKYDIFISYRRDGGEYTARILCDRLQDMGYRVFFDVESLRSGEFNTRLYNAIDSCKDVLVILSPGALDRCVNPDDWVRRELEYALMREKNVIPVLLRGFTFPDTLPETLEPLRYRNGLEANSQFFDAFLQRLTQFLLSRPPLLQKLRQNQLLRKTAPVLLALCIAIAAGFGIKAAITAFSDTYPRSHAEQQLTDELIYYVGLSLTQMDLMADAMEDSFLAVERYISAGASEHLQLQNALELSRNTLNNTDESLTQIPESTLSELKETRYPIDDIRALSSMLGMYKESWLDSLAYLELMVSPEYYLSATQKLEVIDCYQEMLTEDVKLYTLGCNQILTPVTDTDFLKELHYQLLPELSHIPLSASTWSYDYDVLESGMNEAYNHLQKINEDLGTIVGNSTADAAAWKELLIQTYMQVGLPREEAEAAVEQYLIQSDQLESSRQELEDTTDRIREMCQPAEGDSWEKLWFKMTHLLCHGFYEDARGCAALCQKQLTDDPYAEQYFPSLMLYIDRLEQSEPAPGLMVTMYYEPDGINEVFQIGDIIIGFNDQPCGTHDAYTKLKGQLTSKDYTVTVLRRNDRNQLEEMTLQLRTDMPRVGLSDIVYDLNAAAE